MKAKTSVVVWGGGGGIGGVPPSPRSWKSGFAVSTGQWNRSPMQLLAG